MGILSDLFGGSKAYQAQSGLQPGQLQQTYEQQQDALKRMMEFVAATQPGGAQGLAAQMDLSKQLSAMGKGQGPSVAEAMLGQSAGDIAAQQAAVMGSGRGASANVGLMGRQAARGAADIYQKAASEAVTARTREQMAAIEALRQLSGQQAEQYGQATTRAGQASLQAQQQALQAQAQQEALRTEMAKQQEETRGKIVGGVLEGIGAAAPTIFKAEGGLIENQAPKDIVSLLLEAQPMSQGAFVPGKAKVDGDSLKNDTVPALLSPGEIVVPRSAAKDPEKAAAFAKSVAMRAKRRKK